MKRFFENQFPNMFLWTPFAMVFGAAIYFAWPFEPTVAYPFLISVLFICAAIALRRRFWSLLFVLGFGFFYAHAFTHWTRTPKLAHEMRNVEISGTVQNIDHTYDKPRIFIKSELGTLRVSSGIGAPHIGDRIRATVSIFPPDGPDAPGAFDFARWAYFNGLTATGYIQKFTVLDNHKPPAINHLREYIHGRTNSFLSDTLALGYKNAVPRSDGAVWTATGVNHVWSISGFHMTLVGGWLFIVFYSLLRLVAPLTRRMPARYPALVLSWAGLAFYLFLSGFDVATLRAFLMTTLIYAAFILGRTAFSMRNVAIAMIAVFLTGPHFATGPGFQLSFAAMFGILWWFGDAPQKRWTPVRWLSVAAATSIIATVFTAPFIAHHFNFIQIYSLVGNLILLPIFSIAIMPLVMTGTVTALFGFGAPLHAAHSIYDFAFVIAQKIAALPHATIQIPHVSGGALALFIFGFLCIMFINGKIKYVMCAAFLACGVMAVALAPRPVFYSTYDTELVGYAGDGNLIFSKSRASNHYFAFETWKLMNGESPNTPNIRAKCDNGVCMFGNIAYILKYVPLARNISKLCRDPNVDFIVSHFRVSAPNCHAKTIRGGFLIYKDGRVKHNPLNRKWHR